MAKTKKKKPRCGSKCWQIRSFVAKNMDYFRENELMKETLGKEAHFKYIKWKKEAADRCPYNLGSSVKSGEIMFHHEVTNQQLWNMF